MATASASVSPIGFWMRTAAPSGSWGKTLSSALAGTATSKTHSRGELWQSVRNLAVGRRDDKLLGKSFGLLKIHIDDGGDREACLAIGGQVSGLDDASCADRDNRPWGVILKIEGPAVNSRSRRSRGFYCRQSMMSWRNMGRSLWKFGKSGFANDPNHTLTASVVSFWDWF